MKRINTFLLISLFLGSVIMTSCKKNDDPSQSEITESKIQAIFDSIIANTHVPGLVAGIWAPNEGIDFVYAAGVSNIETNTPMDADMIFRIASNTKTFTITVLLQLVDEGLISLDDPLSDYLADFPRANEVTIKMLTNMRSGIFSYDETDGFWEGLFSNPTKFWTTDELISLARDKPYYFNPGTGYHYSNTNTIIIGKIIEMLTGKSLELNINTRILNSLNLSNTTYLVGGTSIPGFHPSAYYGGDYDPGLPELSEYLDVSWAGAAGCMTSNIVDLKKYVEALAGGEFLLPATQQERLVCPEIDSGFGYGEGIIGYKGFYGHNGEYPGFSSLMINSPERKCTIIVWYNCELESANQLVLLKLIPELIYPDF